jgi:hypothetical protein
VRDYNGFSSSRRAASAAWLRRERAAGRVPLLRPCCDGCGQTEHLEPHAEDYSLPFGPHITAFTLCPLCHAMVHLRFQHPSEWNVYRDHVRAGWRARPCRVAVGHARKVIAAGGWSPDGAVQAEQGRTWLDRLEAGDFCPCHFSKASAEYAAVDAQGSPLPSQTRRPR